jgi:para-nitrobenzyl esterase
MGPMDVPGYSEDSLTLNVWTPSPNTTDRLPVLVWFHGGGLLFGAGSASWYDGSVMARRGRIVVVSVNYRLGALGWLYFSAGTLGPKAIANLGLQDQCQALEWVCDNITAFGGDPDTVTISGQSGGGLSVGALHATPRASGLFRRAIVQSAGPGVPAKSVEESERIANILALDRFGGLVLACLV